MSSYWGSVGEGLEETVVSGAAGAVGLVPAVGEIGAAAIHGIDAGAHAIAGGEHNKHIAEREAGLGVASAVPAVGKGVAALDIAQGIVNATSTVGRAAGAKDMPTTGEIINNVIWGDAMPGQHHEGGHE
jgi:hypothetical protein